MLLKYFYDNSSFYARSTLSERVFKEGSLFMTSSWSLCRITSRRETTMRSSGYVKNVPRLQTKPQPTRSDVVSITRYQNDLWGR